jgi:hypothetical protein
VKTNKGFREFVKDNEYPGRLNEDGICGWRTSQAIKAIQEFLVDKNILHENRADGKSVVDGMFGVDTRDALQRYLSKGAIKITKAAEKEEAPEEEEKKGSLAGAKILKAKKEETALAKEEKEAEKKKADEEKKAAAEEKKKELEAKKAEAAEEKKKEENARKAAADEKAKEIAEKKEKAEEAKKAAAEEKARELETKKAEAAKKKEAEEAGKKAAADKKKADEDAAAAKQKAELEAKKRPLNIFEDIPWQTKRERKPVAEEPEEKAEPAPAKTVPLTKEQEVAAFLKKREEQKAIKAGEEKKKVEAETKAKEEAVKAAAQKKADDAKAAAEAAKAKKEEPGPAPATDKRIERLEVQGDASTNKNLKALGLSKETIRAAGNIEKMVQKAEERDKAQKAEEEAKKKPAPVVPAAPAEVKETVIGGPASKEEDAKFQALVNAFETGANKPVPKKQTPPITERNEEAVTAPAPVAKVSENPLTNITNVLTKAEIIATVTKEGKQEMKGEEEKKRLNEAVIKALQANNNKALDDAVKELATVKVAGTSEVDERLTKRNLGTIQGSVETLLEADKNEPLARRVRNSAYKQY